MPTWVFESEVGYWIYFLYLCIHLLAVSVVWGKTYPICLCIVAQ